MCNGRVNVCVDKNKGSERMSGSKPDPLVVGHCSVKIQAGDEEGGSAATVYEHSHIGRFLFKYNTEYHIC